jgi:hypothetical protein
LKFRIFIRRGFARLFAQSPQDQFGVKIDRIFIHFPHNFAERFAFDFGEFRCVYNIKFIRRFPIRRLCCAVVPGDRGAELGARGRVPVGRADDDAYAGSAGSRGARG